MKLINETITIHVRVPAYFVQWAREHLGRRPSDPGYAAALDELVSEIFDEYLHYGTRLGIDYDVEDSIHRAAHQLKAFYGNPIVEADIRSHHCKRSGDSHGMIFWAEVRYFLMLRERGHPSDRYRVNADDRAPDPAQDNR